jgi:hypothetical protein
VTRTRCDNPTCRKVIPAINLEFGGSHTIVNFMEGLDYGRTWYACSPACEKAARKAFEEDSRTPGEEAPWF